MRQRKAKDLDIRMKECGEYLIRLPQMEHRRITPGSGTLEGRNAVDWTAAFGGNEGGAPGCPRPLYLEIGCGKGDFLIAKALEDPDSDYLGLEGQETVLLRALEKAGKIGSGGSEVGQNREDGGSAPAGLAEPNGRPGNLRFVCSYVRSMKDLFADGSLDGIYLNFSDPWPKARHARRRLTWRGRLREYGQALKPGGFIAVKTDNDALFDFTLEEIASCGWTPAEMSRDLHGTDLPAGRIMTEYEKKFHRAGKSINYVKVIV